MSLRDKINSSRNRLAEQPRPSCTVGIALALLEGEDRDSLVEMLGNESFLGTKIAQLLNEWAADLEEEAVSASEEDRPRLEQLSSICGRMAATTVQRHRRGACGCRLKGDLG